MSYYSVAESGSRPGASGDASLVTSAGHYVVASLAPSSRVLYAKSAMRLRRFALSLAAPQPWFPAAVPLICIFIAHLFYSGLAVYSLLSAISFFHKFFSLPDPTTNFIVKRMMIGGGGGGRGGGWGGGGGEGGEGGW